MPSPTPRTMRSRGAILVVASSLIFAACSLTEDQEVAIGRSNADSLNRELPLVRDSNVTGYVSTLGNRIASRTSRRDLHWTFYVVNSRAINAFALPGGFIYVDRGLIEATSSEAELAGALAHEIGHVIERHAVKQMEARTMAYAGISAVCSLTDACKSHASHATIQIGSDAAFARYSRRDEAQADSEAVENTLRAGIDPRGVPALFEKLLQRRQYDPTPLDGWFLDHPMEEARIQHSQQLIAMIDPDELQGLDVTSPAYRSMRGHLKRIPEPVAVHAPSADDSLPDDDETP